MIEEFQALDDWDSSSEVQYQCGFHWLPADLPAENPDSLEPSRPVDPAAADPSAEDDFLDLYASFLGVSDRDQLSWQTQNFKLAQRKSSDVKKVKEPPRNS